MWQYPLVSRHAARRGRGFLDQASCHRLVSASCQTVAEDRLPGEADARRECHFAGAFGSQMMPVTMLGNEQEIEAEQRDLQRQILAIQPSNAC